MTLILPDDPALVQFPESKLRLDLACGLFAAGSVSRAVAARLASLESEAFDEALFARGIPSFTADMLEQDLAAIRERAGE